MNNTSITGLPCYQSNAMSLRLQMVNKIWFNLFALDTSFGLMVLCFVLSREKKLKSRVQELVNALERLTKSSEIRHQQSAEFVNDLKRANR